MLRRLFVESYHEAANYMSRKADPAPDDAPRNMPEAERQVAWRRLSDYLKAANVDLAGEIDPSVRLINICAEILETGRIRYVSWELCTKRGQELNLVKTDPVWKPDSKGWLRAAVEAEHPRADPLCDNLDFKNLLQRRSAAMSISGLTSYVAHEAVTQLFLRKLQGNPPAGLRG